MCLAIPAQITEMKEYHQAIVDVMGVKREISVRLTPDVEEGDWVLVHAGFSIQKETEEGAKFTMELMKELPELTEDIKPTGLHES